MERIDEVREYIIRRYQHAWNILEEKDKEKYKQTIQKTRSEYKKKLQVETSPRMRRHLGQLYKLVQDCNRKFKPGTEISKNLNLLAL